MSSMAVPATKILFCRTSVWFSTSASLKHTFIRCCSNSTPDRTAEGIKHDILDNSMNHVPSYGWTQQSIANGACDCGYSSAVQGMFPRGGTDLALYFYKRSNKQVVDMMEAKIADSKSEDGTPVKLSTGKLIRDAIEDRIRMTSKHQETWPEAMALLSYPSAAGDALQLLGQLVDDIWYAAGDQSHDMNWYTKRSSLAFIYKSTELFMLQDNSEDFEQTWKFLDRRFGDVGDIGSAISTVSDMTSGFVNGGYKSLWTVAKNMSGLYPR